MKQGTLNIIQVQAPTSAHSDQDSDLLYDILLHNIHKGSKKEELIAIMMGDFNAKAESDVSAWARTLDKFGLGQRNDRGEQLLEFCTLHKLVLCNRNFQHKDCRRTTWISPCGTNNNQIDFMVTKQESLKLFRYCRSFSSVEIGSDHLLVLANIKL
ncbi:craniofacial development protein 2-like [Diadema antillarum]|uniref:craniofacial development protein 2-like n=1 Tax=Diadema antillarum TaxID=105358 RepID=UPI003A8B2305